MDLGRRRCPRALHDRRAGAAARNHQRVGAAHRQRRSPGDRGGGVPVGGGPHRRAGAVPHRPAGHRLDLDGERRQLPAARPGGTGRAGPGVGRDECAPDRGVLRRRGCRPADLSARGVPPGRAAGGGHRHGDHRRRPGPPELGARHRAERGAHRRGDLLLVGHHLRPGRAEPARRPQPAGGARGRDSFAARLLVVRHRPGRLSAGGAPDAVRGGRLPRRAVELDVLFPGRPADAGRRGLHAAGPDRGAPRSGRPGLDRRLQPAAPAGADRGRRRTAGGAGRRPGVRGAADGRHPHRGVAADGGPAADLGATGGAADPGRGRGRAAATARQDAGGGAPGRWRRPRVQQPDDAGHRLRRARRGHAAGGGRGPDRVPADPHRRRTGDGPHRAAAGLQRPPAGSARSSRPGGVAA